MLNATYMHNQMTYLWQGPQITVYKCIFFILQFSDKRGTKLSDSEQQIQTANPSQLCLGCHTTRIFLRTWGRGI